jgi:hypothetical protein
MIYMLRRWSRGLVEYSSCNCLPWKIEEMARIWDRVSPETNSETWGSFVTSWECCKRLKCLSGVPLPSVRIESLSTLSAKCVLVHGFGVRTGPNLPTCCLCSAAAMVAGKRGAGVQENRWTWVRARFRYGRRCRCPSRDNRS